MMKKMPKNALDLNNIEIVYEGILKKSPPLKSKSLFNMIAKFSCATDKERTSIFFQKRWRKRYFVLFKTINKSNEIHFLYFKNKPSPDSRSLGSINMQNFGSLSVDVDKKWGKPNVFSIQTIDEKGTDRIYYLKADSYELMNVWVESIVNVLDLNKNRKVVCRSPVIQSPMIQTLKTTPRTSQSRPLTPGNHQIIRRPSKPSVDIGRVPGNCQQNENVTAYYNMDNILSSNLPDTMEDSFFTEEDDIYKFPCEPNQHSYFNLNDDSQTPIPKQTSNVNQMFFGNHSNFGDFSTTPKNASGNLTDQSKNLKANESDFGEKHNDINQFHSDNFINSKDEDFDHDFDFELPSRIGKDDSSSTSSCYSSANTNSSTKESGFNNKDIIFKDLKGICPPQVPKRLNISDNSIIPPPRKQSGEAALYSKLQKTLKSENHDAPPLNGQLDETSMLLNYLDATSLLLENKTPNVPNIGGANAFSNSSDPSFSPFNVSPTMPGDPKGVNDSSPGHDFLANNSSSSNMNNNHNFEMIRDSVSSNLSTIGQIVKDVLPLVEYSEIDDARTEGLHKLNERILKNE